MKRPPAHGQARREIRDPRTLRAIAHPFRLTLLDLLEEHGTLTSKAASDLTGESTAACSFHLRQLAKYGFIEPAAASDRRERPWRRSPGGERVPDSQDPALNRAAGEVTKIVLDRLVADAVEWLDAHPTLPTSWRSGGVMNDELLFLSADELRELSRAVVALLARYRERTDDPRLRPEDAGPVRAAALIFPLSQRGRFRSDA